MLNNARYKAFLTAGSSGTLTPDFTMTHSGTNTSMFQAFEYVGAGNMTSKTVESGANTKVEERNTSGHEINDLNQVLRNSISVNDGAATNWDYTYNPNGCMTGKTDGSSTWTYTWDDDNRLTRVQGPGGIDVSYKYDSMGRMLTRTSGGITLSLTWAGWNCVKETDGTDTFRWYCPRGELHSFERNSTFYQVHSDALGSVRAITDSTGAVVGSYTYAAWGEILSASEPSGFTMPWKFVGSYGVRHDATTDLYYMRNRWYDASLGRFLSRDPVISVHPYAYCNSNPIRLIDRNGLWADDPMTPAEASAAITAIQAILAQASPEVGAAATAAAANPAGAIALSVALSPAAAYIMAQTNIALPTRKDMRADIWENDYYPYAKRFDWETWDNEGYYTNPNPRPGRGPSASGGRGGGGGTRIPIPPEGPPAPPRPPEGPLPGGRRNCMAELALCLASYYVFRRRTARDMPDCARPATLLAWGSLGVRQCLSEFWDCQRSLIGAAPYPMEIHA